MADTYFLKLTKRAGNITRMPGGPRRLVLDVDDFRGPTALARVGTPATITLMQGVDRLAGGEGKTAAQVLAMVADENRELERHIDECLSEAGNDPVLAHFPKALPTEPLSLLIERVAAVATPRPKSTLPLLCLARQLAAMRAEREAAWRKALDLVINEARAGRLTLLARQKRNPTAPFGPVPASFLLGGATIDTTYCHLGYASGGAEDNALRRAIIAPTGDRSIGYFDIILMTDEFNVLMKGRLPPKQARLTPAKQAEIEAWYRDEYVPAHQEAGTIPGREADLAALRRQFGAALISGKLSRALRNKLAPAAWHVPGPKRSGQK